LVVVAFTYLYSALQSLLHNIFFIFTNYELYEMAGGRESYRYSKYYMHNTFMYYLDKKVGICGALKIYINWQENE